MSNIPPPQQKIFPSDYILKVPDPYPAITDPCRGAAGEWVLARVFHYFMAHYYLPHGNRQPIATEYGFSLLTMIAIGNARKAKQVEHQGEEGIQIFTFQVDQTHAISPGLQRLEPVSRTLNFAEFEQWYYGIIDYGVEVSTVAARQRRLNLAGYMGTQVIELSLSDSLRSSLCLRQFPACQIDQKFKEFCKGLIKRPDLAKGRVTISAPQSRSPLQWAAMNQNTLYFHHFGSVRTWIIIPPSQKSKLEALVRELCPDVTDGQADCPRWINHLSLWIEQSLLKHHGIVCYEVEQKVNELLFLFAGTYYMAKSADMNVVEAKYFGGHYWTGNDDDYNIETCNPGNSLCSRFGENLLEAGRTLV
ncbi:hypothetical protein B0J14DRAFT_642803 [Halenospora varia]|nr:hypothetical protein B0J14DRAFT_642803 [Halenospora varia]